MVVARSHMVGAREMTWMNLDGMEEIESAKKAFYEVKVELSKVDRELEGFVGDFPRQSIGIKR